MQNIQNKISKYRYAQKRLTKRVNHLEGRIKSAKELDNKVLTYDESEKQALETAIEGLGVLIDLELRR